MAVKHDLTAGELAVLVNQSPDLRDSERNFDTNKISRYRRFIPMSLRAQPWRDLKRWKYAREAAGWIVLPTRILRDKAVTIERLAEVFRVVFESWGEDQTVLTRVTELYDVDRDYPHFIQRLLDAKLALPNWITTDAATPPHQPEGSLTSDS